MIHSATRYAGFCIRIRAYFNTELSELAPGYLQAAAGYLERFSRLIGPYAYSDFHIVSSPAPVGLGYPNLTYVGRRVLPLPYMRGRSLTHEVLHSWVGKRCVCRSHLRQLV
ncbi:MAG: hypothetical protein OEQ39_28400 [Gammaproteobacteria bacterium]|nr:hypothetical protein [Gammaproteobacteria bacterium]MDH3469341.1 hypothetical protein [Gammaproteobacteria bacterium]